MHKKILIIEDGKELWESIAEILAYKGYQVKQAANGIEGIKAALTKFPDLVFCDVRMPGMDGFDVLHQLRLHNVLVLVPSIFVSDFDERDYLRKGMISGADDYLAKPFTREDILNSIKSGLEKCSLQKVIIHQRNREMESMFDPDIHSTEITKSDHYNPAAGASVVNQLLKKKLQKQEWLRMQEAIHISEINNIIHDIKDLILKELQNKSISVSQKKIFLELKNRIEKGATLSNNLTAFQVKFNQLYPHFIATFTQNFPHLTQYELLLTSSMIVGLNTHQTADLLNISAESVRKSRYRLKKKLGLNRQDDLLKFVQSFNLRESKQRGPMRKKITL